MSPHTHLDQQRRRPGECPACDEAWTAQAVLVARAHRAIALDADNYAQRLHLAELGRRRYGSPR